MEFDLYFTPENGGHTKIKQVLATNVPLSQQRIDRIGPKLVFDKDFTSHNLCAGQKWREI